MQHSITNVISIEEGVLEGGSLSLENISPFPLRRGGGIGLTYKNL
jgi:hypothetical protein